MRHARFAVWSLALSWALVQAAGVCADDDSKKAATKPLDFDRDVAAILARRCLECHNAAEHKGGLVLSGKVTALAGGESGPAVVPGKPDASLLWQRIAADEMPPKKPLPAGERALLRQWIASGAKWGSDPIDPFRFTSESRAGYDWWSLQSVVRPRLPVVKNAAWPRTPIDRFVLAKLVTAGLAPSREADRRTLIRRLTFDLLGLPPTPEEVEAFVADPAADAYQRLVERLLASPHYGERWARPWLDIVHFGESQGFERDKLRLNSWRYRDWVVDALNRDMPYDEFARLQLAGDVLRPSEGEAVIATGFLVTGPYDEVGQMQQSAAMKAVVRQDEMEDVVSLVGQTFLGLTVHCARCHDHKFDPIPQAEYYRLVAALAGVRHGERDAADAALRQRAAGQAAAVERQIAEVARHIAAIERPVVDRIASERGQQKPAEPPRPGARWEFDGDLNDSLGKLHGTAHGGARLENGRLVLNGKTAYVATAPLDRPLKEKTLEAWLTLSDLSQTGGAAISVQTLDGGAFDAIVYGEREPRRWMAGSEFYRRTQPAGGPEEAAGASETVHVAIVYSADGKITLYRNGQPYGASYQSSGPAEFAAGKSQVLFGLRHSPASGGKHLAAAIERAQLYDRALSAAEVAASAGVQATSASEEEIVTALSPAERARREHLRFELAQLRQQRERAAATTVYAVTPQPAEPVHLLRRGNPADRGLLVTAGGVAAVRGVAADFGLPAEAAEGERRVRLARWITDERNPLFARVMANRLWQYHFGQGLVDTPSDLGFNGGRPSHPELLDWLAIELVRQRWSLKALHRSIVLSATYRQASRHDGAAAKVDAGNRLLWRKEPLRLEAETVRDAILSVAGALNPELGGPGFQDFSTFVSNSQFYEMRDPVGTSFDRRSLYRTWVRSGRSRLLDAFDCPDPSTKTPKRAVTTTPLQALSLMNHSFVLRMSERFAERVQSDVGRISNPSEVQAHQQIKRAYALAYGRRPSAEELAWTTAFVSDYGLAALCRVIFNSNEFLYVD